MLHLAVESAFDHLLATWRSHESRHDRPDVPLPELAASRLALDQARNRMHQLRTAIYPDADEIEAIAESVWCETLEVVVHLRWTDRHPVLPGNFSCTCGELVPINWL